MSDTPGPNLDQIEARASSRCVLCGGPAIYHAGSEGTHSVQAAIDADDLPALLAALRSCQEEASKAWQHYEEHLEARNQALHDERFRAEVNEALLVECQEEASKLKEALERIEKHHGYGDHVSCGCLDGVKQIARAALGREAG